MVTFEIPWSLKIPPETEMTGSSGFVCSLFVFVHVHPVRYSILLSIYIYICIMIYVPKTLIANALALAGARLYTSFWLNYNNPLT